MPSKKLKVLMLAFELPPFNSGGLGEAVLCLTKSLAKMGVEITLLLPNKLPYTHKHMKIIFADELLPKTQDKQTQANSQKNGNSINFGTFKPYTGAVETQLLAGGYEILSNLMIQRALQEEFDVIHGHDWMTVKSCLEIKRITNKPLILQIHSTEYDRSPHEYINKYKYTIEKIGMENAEAIIAVSKYTRTIINKHYKIPVDKIYVVYNAPTLETVDTKQKLAIKENIILFIGRITYQKGLHQFLETCKNVINEVPNTLVVVVGNGDMYHEIIAKACEMGMVGKIVFTGFLRGTQRDIVFNSSSVFLMPSLSEPFGLVATEAAQFGVPVVISKQSGVAEVLQYSIKVDFWDTSLMSKEIIKILKNPKIKNRLTKGLEKDLKNLTWDQSAVECIKTYNNVI